jgi:hypothetical protein
MRAAFSVAGGVSECRRGLSVPLKWAACGRGVNEAWWILLWNVSPGGLHIMNPFRTGFFLSIAWFSKLFFSLFPACLMWGVYAALAAGLLVLTPQMARAQTARYSGAIIGLGGGFSGLSGVAVDGSGNVFVADASFCPTDRTAVRCTKLPDSAKILLGSGQLLWKNSCDRRGRA